MSQATPRRSVESTYSIDICPRCEEGVLAHIQAPHEVEVAGSTVRIPRVQMEECRRCGYRALSGREVRLFDVLFAPHYASITELVAALRSARYMGMFLREEEGESVLGFGSRSYVESLAGDLRDLYLDNESSHVLEGLNRHDGCVPVDVGGRRYTIRLPKIGEGENGVVYDFQEDPGAVFKVAKPRPYSRDHLVKECQVTAFFARHGVPVPAIVDHDPYGNYVVKRRLEGQSLAVIYDSLGEPGSPRHRRVRAAVQAFILRLIDLFARFPESKTSVSPNNIFVVEEGECARCLLVDTGPAPAHDYSRFDFDEYWEVTVPEKIERYRAVGYI